MIRTLSLLALLSLSELPSSSATPAAKRTPVATTLASPSPLEAPTCGLPTPGSPACVVAAPPAADPHAHHHHHAAPATEVVDPVCGMTIDPATAGGGSLTENGKTVHFCSSACRTRYLARRDGGTP